MAGQEEKENMVEIVTLEERPQSTGEEIANSISHGIGMLAAAVAAPILILSAIQRGGTAGIVGASVFATTLILLYLTSTLYHALPASRAKRVLKVLDHMAIFLLIAGTYTPFTLGVLRGPWGWTLFGIVWTLAIVGIVLKFVFGTKLSLLSTLLYLVMGWLIIIAIKPLWLYVSLQGLCWLLAGGLAYTAGVAFFSTDHRIRYGHFIWHLFVLAGSSCHFVAVFLYSGGL